MKKFLKEAVPRKLLAFDHRKPLVLFTDAYLSDSCNEAGISAVILNQLGGPDEYF